MPGYRFETDEEIATGVQGFEYGPGGDGASAPVNTIAPAVTGTFDWNETLTSDTGTWAGSPSSYDYQWQRFDTGSSTWGDIAGETGNTYAIDDEADFPGGLRCLVTANNAVGASTPQASNAVASPVAAGFESTPNAWAWLFDLGQSVSVGNPIASWNAHNTNVQRTQGTSSAQPTLLADGVDFDGVTHYLSGGATLGAIFEDAFTVLIGFDGIDDTASTGVRTFFSAARSTSGGLTLQVSANYSRPDSPNATRQRLYMQDGSTSQAIDMQSLSSIGADGYNIAMRSEGRGVATGTQVDEIADPLVAVGTDVTRPANAVTYEYETLGAKEVGAGPTVLGHWEGVVRYVIVLDAAMTDVQVEAWRDALSAAGYL